MAASLASCKRGLAFKQASVSDLDFPVGYVYTIRIEACSPDQPGSDSQIAEISDFNSYGVTASTNGYIQTETIYSTSSNIEKIIVVGNKSLPTGTNITFDVSLNNGSSWCALNRNLNTITDLVGIGGNLVLKFNMITSGSNTPELRDYAVQICTD